MDSKTFNPNRHLLLYNVPNHRDNPISSGLMKIYENPNVPLILYTIALALVGLSSVSGAYNSNINSAIIMAIWSVVIFSYLIANNRNIKIKNYLYIASVVFFLLFLFVYTTGWSVALYVVSVLVYPIPYIILLLFVLFLAQLYLYNKTRLRWLFLGIAIILIIAYFSLIATQYLVTDESVISYYAYRAFLHGADPYSINASANLTYLHNKIGLGLTYNKNSTIVSDFRYPALYFLIQAPFYSIALRNIQYIGSSFSSVEIMTGLIIFLIAYLLLYGEKRDKGRQRLANPSYAAIIMMAILGINQLILLLMLSLILLMYSELGKKYNWLIIGIMVSLQEQLWIIALLFIVYEFMAGKDKGIKVLLGTAAVFLLVNGYFIILNAHAFMAAFTSEISNIIPNDTSALSHIMLILGIPSEIVTIAFLSSILISIFLLARLKDYRLIPILSVIPFLFLSHSGASYFVIPFIVFAFINDPYSGSKRSHAVLYYALNARMC